MKILNHSTVLYKISSWLEPLGDIYYEVKIDNLRPDILIKTKDNKTIVVEYQHSERSHHYITGKTIDYSKNNIYCLWIFHTSLMHTTQYKEAYDIYKTIYTYDDINNQIWKDDYRLYHKKQTVEIEDHVYKELIENVTAFNDMLEITGKDLNIKYNRTDFSYNDMPLEYSILIDETMKKIMKKIKAINLELKIEPYLNYGLKLAYI